MLYNKPRDIKLRALPTISSIIKKADSVKSKFTKAEEHDDTDKLILSNEAVPRDSGNTVSLAIPEKKTTPSTVINKNVDGDTNNDFDIILTDPPVKSNEHEVIFDLTEMPVIEGIPMLTLPDEPKRSPEVKRKEIIYFDTAKPEKASEKPSQLYSEDAVFDLSEMPDIDGVPMLELKPVSEEKIQLLEDFVYKPTKEVQPKATPIPRPDIDIDEPVHPVTTDPKAIIKKIVVEPVIEEIPQVEEIAVEPVIEEIPEVEEITEESVIEEIPQVEEIAEESVIEEIPEVEEITVEPVIEEIPEVDEIIEEPVIEEIPQVEEIAEEPVIEEIPEVDEITVEPVTEESEEISATSSDPIAPPPFIQASAKKGRKAKKKEKQKKNTKKQPKLDKTTSLDCVSEEKVDTVPLTQPKKNKDKKAKKSKPIITNKRLYLKKKGVKIKLRVKGYIDNRREKAKKKRPFGKARALKVASFFIMLYVGTALAFTLPIRPTYSETEKRSLAQFPEFSAQALLSGEYFSDIDTWFSDTFPFRESLTQTDTFIKSLYGTQAISIHGDVDAGDEIPDAPIEDTNEPQKPEINEPVTMPDDDELSKDNGNPNAQKPDYGVQELSAIVVAGDSAYEYYSFSQDVAPRFIERINRLDSIVKPSGNVYAMIVPTSMDITLNDALRAEVNSANQKKALDFFNASFKNTIAVDGIYDSLREHRNEYIYFRADHHWTALGAYYTYEQFAMEKGITPVPLSKYKTKTFDNFIGTFYSSSGQNPALKEKPDYVTAYLPFNKVTCKISDSVLYEGFDYDVIKDVSDYTPGSKYLTFIGGDNGLTTITNLDSPRGESCLVIKDSYANAFVPFLIPHYSNIYVIDPRHYKGTLAEFCENKIVDDVIVLTNISTTRNYVYLEGLENFVQ